MLTQTQIRTEIYNALNVAGVTALVGTRIYWINRLTVNNTFPLITYSMINISGNYAFGLTPSTEDIVTQVDIYASPEEVGQLDGIIQEVKVALEAIDYRMIASSGESFDSETEKNRIALRFERINA